MSAETSRAPAPRVHALAGKPPTASMLIDVPRLITAYYTQIPDPTVATQRVSFGTSGHRGSSLRSSFNEWHVLAITQAICDHRARQNVRGPLFLGTDTHALSAPACASALEVLAANGVEVMLSANDEYTPTPAVSHAILTYNRSRDSSRDSGMADGIVVTPSHNPPDNGGFKYNPPNGGPADTEVTAWIEDRANGFLGAALEAVKRMPYERALRAASTHRHDYLSAYVADLEAVIDLAAIRAAGVRMGVDPLGGAGTHYWGRIAERYGLDLAVVSEEIDPTFRFMTVDWDGRIRMDPSSVYAMQRLVGLKDRFDVAFGCDTDHDRHGIVTRSGGLMNANHYLSVCIDYLFQHRSEWPAQAAVGKTVVSSQMIDRVAARRGRRLFEVPVGFKWYVAGLLDGSVGFGGEESAGAAFLRRNGEAWVTDKDGLIAALLAGEITARLGRDPSEHYHALTQALGNPLFDRIDAPAGPEQRRILGRLSPGQVKSAELAGEKIQVILTRAPGNDAPIGGLKVVAENGWFAARPSGTEDIYKVYAESFRDAEHLRRVIAEAQGIVSGALGVP
jgi:phosphoglucomutase